MVLAIFTLAVASGLGWLYLHIEHPTLPHAGQPVGSMQTAAASSSEGDFSDAMARLNTAFQARSPSNAEQVVAQVNAGVAPGIAKPCPFEWRNGEADLSLATDLHGKLPLTQTINACADSIQRLP